MIVEPSDVLPRRLDRRPHRRAYELSWRRSILLIRRPIALWFVVAVTITVVIFQQTEGMDEVVYLAGATNV